jgi:hypothetical protein
LWSWITSVAELRNKWSRKSTPSYVFVAWTGTVLPR